MKKILIATSSFGMVSNKPVDLLKAAQLEIVYNNTGEKMSDNEVLDKVNIFSGIIAGTEVYSKNIFHNAKKLKVISRLGVGIDNIDLKAAKENCVKIYYTQTNPAMAVAELTLGLMLDICRKISVQNNNVKSGKWQKQMGNLLQGKTLGIIGLGTIGKELIKLVQGFNFNILAYDIHHDENYARKYKVVYCNIQKLLSKSDIVSVHLNLSAETKGIINEKLIKQIKTGSILINTSRGEVLDERALLMSIKENKISGAGLDVFAREPYSGPLMELDNVVLTPHIGAYAKEIRVKMEMEAAENLINGLNEV